MSHLVAIRIVINSGELQIDEIRFLRFTEHAQPDCSHVVEILDYLLEANEVEAHLHLLIEKIPQIQWIAEYKTTEGEAFDVSLTRH